MTSPALVSYISSVSNFGNYVILPVCLTLAITLLLLTQKAYKDMLLLYIANASYLLSQALKILFKQERPSIENVQILSIVDTYSFPSTHVFYYSVFWGFVCYLAWKYIYKGKCKNSVSSNNPSAFSNKSPSNLVSKLSLIIFWLIALISTHFIALVGISRIILKAHWFVDVLGGYLLGFLYLVVLVLVSSKKSSNV